MRHENLFIPVTLIISIAYSFSMFLASLALTRRLGFQKSCYMILESGYYLHHKALLYFILLITIKRSQWLIIASSYHEISFKHQRPDYPVRYHEAR